ncbi:hypothetical protein HMPREF0972_00164 [Actinomyces sp. oral taxon 848 str. F0332]|nr:hypothetical protein HMPREF0972_00164 [Actinomyces sp. oral taxon 848 str. F0332]
MHIGGLLPFHAIRTSFIRSPVELSLTELRRPFELDGKLALPSRVGPNSHRPPESDQTRTVLPSWTKLVLSSRVGPDSCRPPKSTRAFLRSPRSKRAVV